MDLAQRVTDYAGADGDMNLYAERRVEDMGSKIRDEQVRPQTCGSSKTRRAEGRRARDSRGSRNMAVSARCR